MFRIRRVYDDITPANQDAIAQVQAEQVLAVTGLSPNRTDRAHFDGGIPRRPPRSLS